MSLAGLLSILDDDPRLRDVVARAGAGPDLPNTDLVAPPALRPVLAAALAQGTPGFVLAVTATAREAEDLAAGLGSFLPPEGVATFPGWKPCRTSGCRRVRTRWGSGSRCCAGSPTPRPPASRTGR